MDESIRFGVLGYGHIGKRHAAILQALPGAVLTAVCDKKQQSPAPAVPFFSSLSEMLRDASIDIVTVATPNGLHVPHALQILEAAKHVVVEKPLGLDAASCRHLINTAEKFDKQVFCVMQNRYSPSLAWAKTIMETGRLGKIYMVEATCFWSRNKQYYAGSDWKGTMALDGGTLFTQFSHFVDVVYWLFGDFKNVDARFYDFNHQHITEFEDSGIIHFNAVDNCACSFMYSTSIWDTNFESSLTVIGEHGTFRIGGQYMNELVYCHIKDYQPPLIPAANPANTYGGYSGSAANHSFVFENIVHALNGRPAIITNAEEGLKVVEIIEKIYQLKPKMK